MARNRFDVDETLETPFNIKHLLRAGVYIKRHKQKMILSLVFSAISAACALVGPKLIETALNVAVPNRDYKMLFILAGIMLLSIFRVLRLCPQKDHPCAESPLDAPDRKQYPEG